MKKLYIELEEEIKELSLEEWCHVVAKQLGVEGQEIEGTHFEPDKVVQGLANFALSDQPLPDDLDQLSQAYDQVKELIAESKKLSSDKEKLKKAAAEEAKREKKEKARKAEEEKEQLAVRRNSFTEAVARSLATANDDLRNSFIEIKEALPEGIEVEATEGGSFGLRIDSSVTDEQLAGALGSFIGKERNTDYLKSAHQFFIGEIANEMVRRGIFPSMIKCGEALSERCKNEYGLRLGGRAFENYARMAARIPVEYRNQNADPTAYLAVSEIPYPKKPRRDEFANQDDHKKALKVWEDDCASVDSARLRIAAILRDGGYKTKGADGKEEFVEVLSRKDVLPIIDETKIQLGLKKAPNPSERSLNSWLRQYFDACTVLDLFKGVHAPDVVRVGIGAGSTDLSEEDLAVYKEEAYNKIIEILYPEDKRNELLAGERERQVQVYDEVDGKKIAKKDEEGNPVKETKVEKIYVKLPWLD